MITKKILRDRQQKMLNGIPLIKNKIKKISNEQNIPTQ